MHRPRFYKLQKGFQKTNIGLPLTSKGNTAIELPILIPDLVVVLRFCFEK